MYIHCYPIPLPCCYHLVTTTWLTLFLYPFVTTCCYHLALCYSFVTTSSPQLLYHVVTIVLPFGFHLDTTPPCKHQRLCIYIYLCSCMFEIMHVCTYGFNNVCGCVYIYLYNPLIVVYIEVGIYITNYRALYMYIYIYTGQRTHAYTHMWVEFPMFIWYCCWRVGQGRTLVALFAARMNIAWSRRVEW